MAATRTVDYWGADPLAAYRLARWSVYSAEGRYLLACGDGLVALALEWPEGVKALERLEAAHGTLPKTWRWRDGGAPVMLFRHRGTLGSAPNLHGTTPGVHLRGVGASVTLPPSPGPTGDALGWQSALRSLSLEEIPDLPGWLERIARDPAEGRRAWDRVLKPAPNGFARTDLGNAERLVARHGRDLKYCHTWKSWLCWDGVRWRRDDTGEVMRRAKDTTRAIVDEAQACTHEETRKALLAHALSSEKASRLASMVSLASTEAGVPVQTDALDADLWSLNCANGLVDLRTGVLAPHRREDLCTKLCPVAYDPEATAPVFEAFLERVQPDPEMRAFLARLVGYFTTGVIRDHVFPIHYGVGGNGKGTFTELVLAVLGEYGRQVPTELLLAKDRDGHPTDRMTLFGTRFAAASETEEGRKLANALVKLLTGGDTVSARGMHENFTEWKPTHHLWLQTNHRPVVEDTSEGIWRRVLLVGWDVQIPPEEQDTSLPERLAAEHSGVLAWIVRGARDWCEGGLRPPERVRAATRAYRAESDWMQEFLDACCSTQPEREGGPAPKAFAKALYAAYKAFAEESGLEVRTQTAFGRGLSAKGFRKEKSGTVSWEGVRLVPRASRSWEDD